MIDSIALIVAGVLIVFGSAFAAVAALGLLRLPDIYTRMHSASKAGSVGSGMLLIALALVSDSTGEVLRAIVAVGFFLLTAPISAHLLGRAAYSVGHGLWSGSVLDEMPPVESMVSGHAKPSAGLVDHNHPGSVSTRDLRST